jgi:1-aminocyclopropane-1-carboxylate deaminase/D-cysteine desulfhydrase-like pyridoxal-dependent ACC family enzyme
MGARVPEVLAIGVAKGVNAGAPDVVELARECVALLDGQPDLVQADDVALDPGWLGDDYGIPTVDGDAAIGWAARRGAWVLDRTYTGKGFAGLLGQAAAGRWPAGSDVVWIHTGGVPAVFAPGGSP